MTRRNQRRTSQKNRHPVKSEKLLVCMLDNRRINYFRYDAKAILNTAGIEQEVLNPLLASIVTKANRISIDEASKYVHQQEKNEVLTRETAKSLLHLLDKYKRWR